ncbi:MAG: pyridoxal phosphate-dependent aminotransferase, partial [Bacillota bacterium]|nr:pyridoxal phosphate-dependent aminotransferase [Bacillota bacterium]
NAPQKVKAAAIKALEQDDTHYTHSLGKISLREAIVDYYRKSYGVEIDKDRIVVTSGTSPAMVMALGVLLNDGDEVIMPNPHYACYPNFVRIFRGVVKDINVEEADGFKYNMDKLKAAINENTKAIFVNSPANPTGAVYNGRELKAIAALGRTVISDEIYHGLVYEGECHSMLEYTDNAIVLNGFSKLFAMTGFRLGYAIVPPEMARTFQKMQQNFYLCAGSFVQEAAIAALTEDCSAELAEMKATYNKRRLFLAKRLEEMGIAPLCTPQGAFYMLANVKKYTNDSHKFALEVLKNAKVALTPGIDFGSNAQGYLRISYANSLENIREGLDRLEKYLKTL